VTAEIIDLPRRHPVGNPGNGALDAVRDYLERVNPARVMARSILEKDESFEGLDSLPDADHFLAWMWDQGFKVVPVVE
jgi:hypothetical protein